MASSLDTAVVIIRPRADTCSVSSIAAPRPWWSSAEPPPDTSYSLERYTWDHDRYEAFLASGDPLTRMLPFSTKALTTDEFRVEDFTVRIVLAADRFGTKKR
jgi:hypothetical protein